MQGRVNARASAQRLTSDQANDPFEAAERAGKVARDSRQRASSVRQKEAWSDGKSRATLACWRRGHRWQQDLPRSDLNEVDSAKTRCCHPQVVARRSSRRVE